MEPFARDTAYSDPMSMLMVASRWLKIAFRVPSPRIAYVSIAEDRRKVLTIMPICSEATAIMLTRRPFSVSGRDCHVVIAQTLNSSSDRGAFDHALDALTESCSGLLVRIYTES